MEHLTIETFKEKIFDFEKQATFKGTTPVIIDFYADWCGPCRAIAPILDELSEEYIGKINFYKVNVDDQSEISQHFHIKNIPAVLFIPIEDQISNTANMPVLIVGAKPKTQFVDAIKTIFK
jgi:thioredoxin 1